VGDPVALMGPTGVRTRISENGEVETVLIIGNALSIADVRVIGSALRKVGSKVLYFLELKDSEDLYCKNEIENATDAVVWVMKNNEQIQINRIQDCSVKGNITTTLKQYAKGELYSEKTPISLKEIDRVILVGSPCLIKQFKAVHNEFLNAFLTKNPKIIASVHGSMQCMLKGVCAQCLQWQIDPQTGERTKAVFACSWHNQPIEIVDWDHLEERLKQNRLQEQITNWWLDYLFERHQPEKI
jgi:adenylate kinase family enzyme